MMGDMMDWFYCPNCRKEVYGCYPFCPDCKEDVRVLAMTPRGYQHD